MNAKTQARIDSIMVQVPTNIIMSEANRDIVRERVRLALLEQDADTREACAESADIALRYGSSRALRTDVQRTIINTQSI